VLRDPIGRPARPPKLVVAVLSATLSAGVVFAMVDWWPGKGHQVDEFTNGLLALLFGVLLLIVGLVWAIKSLYVVGRDRRWSWWIAPAPTVVVLAAVAVLMFPGPSFHSSRNAFDAAVQQVLTSPEPQAFDVRVGPHEISRIVRDDDGAVYFYDSDQAFLTVSGGWVYSPSGPPPTRMGVDVIDAVHIDGPWYEFTSAWRE
jgi:hypothetical protein